MLTRQTKEIVTYLIFGVLTTAVSWISYTCLITFAGFPVFPANLTSWICSVLFAYITNKLWVFESRGREFKILIQEMLSFFAARGITGIIEIAAVPLLAKSSFDQIFYHFFTRLHFSAGILYTDGIYSKVIISFIIVILNYVFSKLIVFNHHEPHNEKDG